MKKRQPDTTVYKTEEMLKEEAKRHAAEQARLDAAKPPSSAGQKKRENYWYHYKWHTIGGIAAMLMLAFFVKDMIFREKPDATIIMISTSPFMQETVESAQSALEMFAGDFNGDGKIVIQIDSVYLPSGEDGDAMLGGQQDYASVMKLTTVVAAGSDPIYLLDDGAYEYLENMANSGDEAADSEPVTKESIFLPLTMPGSEGDRLPVSATALAVEPELEPLRDMAFSLRLLPGDKNEDYEAYCLALLTGIGK